MILKKQGVKVEAKASVQKIEGTPGAMTVTYTDKKGAEHTVTAQGRPGRRRPEGQPGGPFGPDFSLSWTGGGIVGMPMAAPACPTSMSSGDAKARNIQLAHVASAQGRTPWRPSWARSPPWTCLWSPAACTPTRRSPRWASPRRGPSGGIPVKPASTSPAPTESASSRGTESGYVKLVTDQATGRILGAQMVCPRATDLVGELTLAIQKGITAGELATVIHPHPTFSEMLFGAAESLRPE